MANKKTSSGKSAVKSKQSSGYFFGKVKRVTMLPLAALGLGKKGYADSSANAAGDLSDPGSSTYEDPFFNRPDIAFT